MFHEILFIVILIFWFSYQHFASQHLKEDCTQTPSVNFKNLFCFALNLVFILIKNVVKALRGHVRIRAHHGDSAHFGYLFHYLAVSKISNFNFEILQFYSIYILRGALLFLIFFYFFQKDVVWLNVLVDNPASAM